MHTGLFAAALAYIIWGLFPLYFHQLREVPALEVVMHRSVWSLAFIVLVLLYQRRWAWLINVLQQPRKLAIFGTSALLLSSNWLLYVWAVNNGRVLEASLGYFINPLFNVLLGVLVLRERPRPLQWAAVGIAGVGVLWLGVAAGAPPWISLALAASFGLYGLLKKTAPLGALEGLALETLLLAPLAVPALAWMSTHGGTLANATPSTWAWLLAAGPLTAVPLLLFAYGAQRIQLGTLGLLQYLGPSLQFALGVWVFHEPLHHNRLAGFALIWMALLIYSGETLWRLRQNNASPQNA
ncbi:EamA family transporter RarD [Ideonella margarita]|uniref:EamA family transporter RarD n=1 Tax=Ideonella margarita TaxID=2984191 RepID=A0ABU9C825_9BURK